MIDQRLVPLALQHVDTGNFERFGQTFYGAMQDREFVPLGGMHDGGAEGYDAPGDKEPELFVDESASRFLQVSKQVTTRKKIRGTVDRLRKYGRDPKVLTYVTSVVVPDIDVEERALSKELGCQITIRDANFIEININSNTAIQGAFKSYLEPSISYLFQPGAADTGSRAEGYADRTLAVFLRQEVEHRRDRSGLLESVADSLILWSLSDTDPDKGVFLEKAAIQERIEAALPSAKHFIRGVLDNRLAAMVKKSAPGGREIRWYRKDDKYCLPYETRVIVAAENAEDDLLKLKVSCVFEDRLSNLSDDDSLRGPVVHACHDTLERVFEKQGLEVALFATNGARDDELYTDVSQLLTDAVDNLAIGGETKTEVRRLALAILKETFYRSTEVERLYLQKMSKTYVLLLLLKNEPRIVEYFRSLAGSFHLYIGTDLIIRTLSEHYLSPDNQTTLNMFSILRSAGAELILTQKTVEEVATHLRRQMFEFENHYERVEHKVTEDLVDYIDRLLIRAYFHARLSPVPGSAIPKSWRAYMSQFANYGDIRSNRGDRELAGYLTRKFGFSYESTKQMEAGIDRDELNDLSKKIQEVRAQAGRVKAEAELLAYNDALHVLRVYKRREERGEESPGNPFGYQTWWLTQDTKVRRAGASAAARHAGAYFMMRPEFLLNYISLAPEHAEVVKSYQNIFPTALGVRLSARLSSDTFDKVMADATEVAVYDDARAGAMITDLTNRLKGDSLKMYENRWKEKV
jgi:hypothetical protein